MLLLPSPINLSWPRDEQHLKMEASSVESYDQGKGIRKKSEVLIGKLGVFTTLSYSKEVLEKSNYVLMQHSVWCKLFIKSPARKNTQVFGYPLSSAL